MENLNWGYLLLGLVALIFGGLQVWWIGSVFWKRKLARPLSEGEFRKALERIWRSGPERTNRPRFLTELHKMGSGHRAVLGGSAFLLPRKATAPPKGTGCALRGAPRTPRTPLTTQGTESPQRVFRISSPKK